MIARTTRTGATLTLITSDKPAPRPVVTWLRQVTTNFGPADVAELCALAGTAAACITGPTFGGSAA